MNRIACCMAFITLGAVLLGACAPSAAAVQTAIAETQSMERIPTLAPRGTQGPSPTAPAAAVTALPPQASPLPSVAIGPQARPIKLIGTGDSVVEAKKWAGAALLHAVYTGSGNFSVRSYDASAQPLELLVNATGAYEGTALLDGQSGQQTARLEVKAAGPWVLDIRSWESARAIDLPATINGKGDDVLRLRGNNADTILAITNGKRNFIVRGYTGSGDVELLFNETGPYRGSALLPADTLLLAVQATGEWSLQIATR